MGPDELTMPVNVKMSMVQIVGQMRGRMICTSSRKGPHPSSRAASRTSMGTRAIAPPKRSILPPKPVQMTKSTIIHVAELELASRPSGGRWPPNSSTIASSGPPGSTMLLYAATMTTPEMMAGR